MLSSEFGTTDMPEWYRTERDTAKIIEKLGRVKELDFYLRNPDEYIRRLAILRLYKIPDKESIFVLKEILDDPIESEQNKYLAAWILKSFSKKWVSDIFSNNRFLNKFNGNESFDDLFNIKLDQASSFVEFDFKASPSFSLLKLDSDESALQRDIFFETEFDFKKWFSSFGTRLRYALVSTLCAIPLFIIRFPKLLYVFVLSTFNKLSKHHTDKKLARIHSREERMKEKEIKRAQKHNEKLKNEKAINLDCTQKIDEATKIGEATKINMLKNIDNAINPQGVLKVEKEGKIEKATMFKRAQINERKVSPERLYQNNASFSYNNLRKELYKKPGIFSYIKKGVFQVLYVLFFPIRFALKHKLAIICTLLLTYSLLTFTNYGRAFTNKYWNIDLKEVQNNTFHKIKEYSVYALSEFNRLSGINEWKGKEDSAEHDSPDILMTSNIYDSARSGKLYTVTAKKGLNIRKSPDATSEKVGSSSLALGSTVTYLSDEKKDASGITWYYIKAQDGRTGWVSSLFLKEKKEG